MNTVLLSEPFVLATGTSNAALVTFLVYTLAVFGLAAISNRLLQKKSFLSEYFLGSRGLGMWAFALTFAATSASGGSFTGFPSKIYSHGWILGLWIGSYIVFPICAMGLLGKRINQLARISGAITVPDVLRDRFRSAKFGLLAVSLIVFFMSFNLVAQFKAGSLILKTLVGGVDLFQDTAVFVGGVTSHIGFLRAADPEYLVCLLTFGLAVIIYTTYGGFHAVVWTDVMQGIVMVVGVLIMLPLAIYEVSGLPSATKAMAKMTPPRRMIVSIECSRPSSESRLLSSGTWFTLPGERDGQPRLFRITKSVLIEAGQMTLDAVEVLEITTPEELDRLLSGPAAVELSSEFRLVEPLGNSDWFGTATLSLVAETARSDDTVVEQGTWFSFLDPADNRGHEFRTAKTVVIPTGEVTVDVPVVEPAESAPRTASLRGGIVVSSLVTKPVSYQYGDSKTGVYVTGPGPHDTRQNGFLPLGLAISFFFMWAISGSGQPSSMVRLMAFKNTATLRRAIFTVAMYYSMIYFPLVIIFCCARLLMPGMDAESDRIMPAMAVFLTENIGLGWLAGLLVAAPFAAVMSTVDSFLLMISSGLVRDIYQRNINPEVSEKTIRWMSYLFTLMVGTAAMLGAVNPPAFLQDIIVYTASGLAACFLGPMVFTLYWPRANVQGCMAGMIGGFLAHLSMYISGIFENGSFFLPSQLFSLNPVIIGLISSFATAYIVTKLTPPPPEDLVRKYFYRKRSAVSDQRSAEGNKS